MLLESLNFLRETNRNLSNLKILKQSIDSRNISHAYLFAGSNINCLMQIALNFAASINCFKKGCGICNICRNILKQVYDSLLVIEPTGSNNMILTQSISEIQNFVGLSSRLGSYKVCIIKEADLLNKVAANKFLKTLEEPQDSKTIFILLTENLQNVIGTIVSRCIVFEWDFILKDSSYNYGLNNYNLSFNSGYNISLNEDIKIITDIIDSGLRKIISNDIENEDIENKDINRKPNDNNDKLPVEKQSYEDARFVKLALDLTLKISDFQKNLLSKIDNSVKNKEILENYKNIGLTNQEIKKIEKELLEKNKKEAQKNINIGLNIVFDIITAWLEDIITARLGLDKIFLNYKQNYDFIINNLSAVKLKDVLDVISYIEKARISLKYFANSELLMDNIFLSIGKLNC